MANKNKLTKYSKDDVNLWYLDYLNGLGKTNIVNKYNIDIYTVDDYFKKYDFDVDWRSLHVLFKKELLPKYEEAASFYNEGSTQREAIKKSGGHFSRCSFKRYLTLTQPSSYRSLSEAKSFLINPDFFEKIDSELKAYLLGFYAADGYMSDSEKGSTVFGIGVQKGDYPIVNLFNQVLTGGRTKIIYEQKSNSVTFAVRSNKIKKDLIALGFPMRKTYEWNKLPNIEKPFMRHFIRGFFDGDGSVMNNFRTKNSGINGKTGRLCFACYNKEILQQVEKELGVDFSYRLRKDTSSTIRGRPIKFTRVWTAEIQRREDLKKIHNYFYKDAIYYFRRKKEKFDLAILTTNECCAALIGDYKE